MFLAHSFLYIQSKKKYPILVDGQDQIATTIGKCCNPKPGDEIIGYITKNNGVSIHKKTCQNIKKARDSKPSSIVNVSWRK
jgi:GTP pyrophosphokinase